MFAEPTWLWGLAALPLIALAAVLALRRDRERVARLVSRPLWARVVEAPAEHWRWLRLTLLLIGAAGLVLALARPQWGVVREAIEREGVDVVLVLDTSGSMATRDVQPDRFFLARQALLSLVSQLDQDRFALVAFEGEAYPLVPLTLDADAVGLFLETLQPGFVPGPGTALGQGLERGLELFVDEGRRNKVMVLVSDGENLEGEIQRAVAKAAAAGVVIHTVGVGTEQGQPVPDFDANGEPAGFKKDASGTVVVSKLEAANLEAIARGTSGRYVHITPADSSLREIAAAIDAMEERTLARDFDYRKVDRFQLPLGVALVALTLAALLPPPRRRRIATAPLALAAALLAPTAARAQDGSALDEVLLRPTRLTDRGLAQLGRGDHPGALKSFEEAAALRAGDPLSRFNLAGGLYRNGRYPDAAAVYRELADAPDPALAAAARYDLGNTLYESQSYEDAIQAYRGALELDPDDEATRRNLELALRRLQEQKEQQQQQQDQQSKDQQGSQDQKQQPQQDQKQQDQQQPQQDQKQQDQQQQQQQQQQDQQQREQQQQGQGQPSPAQQREDQRFEREAGMPRERAMQLLEALQQNEKEEQRKTLLARKKKKAEKDW